MTNCLFGFYACMADLIYQHINTVPENPCVTEDLA